MESFNYIGLLWFSIVLNDLKRYFNHTFASPKSRHSIYYLL